MKIKKLYNFDFLVLFVICNCPVGSSKENQPYYYKLAHADHLELNTKLKAKHISMDPIKTFPISDKNKQPNFSSLIFIGELHMNYPLFSFSQSKN